MSDKAKILAKLTDSRGELTSRFDVARIGLFGSAARDEMGAESDIDILVAFRHSATFANYMALKFFLEELFGRPVDLVTETGLKPRARPFVEQDLIRVA